MTTSSDFMSELEAKVAQQLDSQRVGYLLGAGSSYLKGNGYPLAFELWGMIKPGIADRNKRDEIQAKLDSGATGIELVYQTSPATYGRGIDSNADHSDNGRDAGVPLRDDAGRETPRLLAALRSSRALAAFDPLSTLAAAGPEAEIDEPYAAIARLVADGLGTTAFAADGRRCYAVQHRAVKSVNPAGNQFILGDARRVCLPPLNF